MFNFYILLYIRLLPSMTDVKHYRGIALSSLICRRVLLLSIMKIFILTVCNLLTNLILQTFQCVSSIIETMACHIILTKRCRIFAQKLLLMLQRLSIKLIYWYFLINYMYMDREFIKALCWNCLWPR